ncbi:lipopolysaccharide transport system ATP-binding protein [Andreprevotia lacus DSM 23236]|jgi:lipopolysaccharide transport system ATP-binding protein|uniref:Lipopolysaccharide transport system ATP-binding protein n=1 Tax=Andreprevotia lacus DSM 23236 TaxID=1121001 RepID=A0A1W1XZP0_9NEIS|nr:ABC transporter ATP-binding protein [Andreprevotia lacus]SMC28958.1 lipopolysaccharide transport system ATP-binding protein [Andreprevotia lacus DSM 23236]
MSFDTNCAVIAVDGLSKSFPVFEKPHHRLLEALLHTHGRWSREFHALRDVSFEVGRGETVGIIGRNGSGKSTLLQLICGTLTPTSGRAEVKGRVAALLELGAGFNPEFTGIENIYLNAAILGLPSEKVGARLPEILAFADIGDFVHQPVKTYSSGMFVRLAFAVIAHVDADILVIDEALAVGDAFFTQKCMRFLRRFRENGGTLLFVSHDSGAVTTLCDRAIWLDKGQIRAQGSSKWVTEQYLQSKYASDDPSPNIGLELAAETAADDESAGGQGGFTVPASEHAFGSGEAKIALARLETEQGQPLLAIVGGEDVVLRIEATALARLARPILGFYIKNRLGQVIFGENSTISPNMLAREVVAGESLAAEFRFRMPHLLAGDYVITAAIAEGDQDEHRVLHWIHDAAVFQSQSKVLHGLLALPTKVAVSRGAGAAGGE